VKEDFAAVYISWGSFAKTMVDDTISITDNGKYSPCLAANICKQHLECGSAFCMFVQIVVISKEKLVKKITNIIRKMLCDQLENDDIQELLISRLKLTNDDLLLDQQTAFEEADNDAEKQVNVHVKELTLKEFEDIF
jgi:hypothetical protein